MTVQEAISNLRAYAKGYAGNILGMCALAADLLESNVPRWISVEERLPDLFSRVLVIVQCKSAPDVQEIKISSRYTPIGCYHTEWRWGCGSNETVTHWMPLPSLPQEVAHECQAD